MTKRFCIFNIKFWIKIVIGLVLFQTAPAIADHSDLSHWGSRTISVADATENSEWSKAIVHGVNAWQSGFTQLDFILTTAAVNDCDVKPRDRILICIGDPGKPEWIASASRSHSTDGHIDGSLITVRSSGRRYAHAIICHELGHSLGLKHRSQDSASCLTPKVGPNSRWPDAHDYEAANKTHDHVD